MPAVRWQIRTLGHSCTGSCICTRDECKVLRINPECPVAGHSGEVTSVAFSEDGRRVVSGSEDTLVKMWDADKGSEVCNPGECNRCFSRWLHSCPGVDRV